MHIFFFNEKPKYKEVKFFLKKKTRKKKQEEQWDTPL